VARGARETVELRDEDCIELPVAVAVKLRFRATPPAALERRVAAPCCHFIRFFARASGRGQSPVPGDGPSMPSRRRRFRSIISLAMSLVGLKGILEARPERIWLLRAFSFLDDGHFFSSVDRFGGAAAATLGGDGRDRRALVSTLDIRSW